MRFSVTGLLLLTVGQLFGQTLFADQVKQTDSLNSINYSGLKSTGQFDDKGTKTGFWTEYKLSVDTTNSSTPLTIQGVDFALNMEFQKPSKLEKIEGTYTSGVMTGQWKWFEATYYYDSLTWEVTRETMYLMGKKQGAEKEYSLGQLYREAHYTDDEPMGTEIHYYPPGVVYAKAQWKGGVVKNATWYYQDGKVKTTKDYKKYPSTKVIEYYGNGKTKAKYTVLGDEETIDGDYQEFDPNGNLVERRMFSKGVEVKK